MLALFAGISRSGITMVAGLIRGLNYEDAARFSFLLATPVILARRARQDPRPARTAGQRRPGAGARRCCGAFVAALVSVRFLTRYFKTRTLWPFGLYCLVAGTIFIIRFA